MGERKVLNKYFPPDFDPSLVPRRKRPKNAQVEVRMMLPFSLQCATCGEYMYRGKKFNSRKEEVVGEDYHGIRIFRFYIKCVTCSAEITFKTDPRRGDYVAEHGCQRNFEPWREREDEQAAAAQQKAEEEEGDAMQALESRTLDSKREMDLLDALDEIKAVNQRHARVDTDALLRQSLADGQAARDEQRQREDAEDQQAARAAFANAKAAAATAATAAPTSSGGTKRPAAALDEDGAAAVAPAVAPATIAVVVVKKKKKKKAPKKAKKAAEEPKDKPAMRLVADYSDSD